MIVSDYIPRENFNKWMSIFKGTSGYFLNKPFDCSGSVHVRYTFVNADDYKRLNDGYRRLTTNITEVKRNWFGKVKAKLIRYVRG